MIDGKKNRLVKFLRWSEQYTKTDMVYFFLGSSWLTAGHMFSTFIILLSSIAFANLLSVESYGTYKYILSLIGMFSITTLSGMGGVVTQAVPKGFGATLLPALKTKIRWGFLGCIASIVVSLYYFFNGNALLGMAFLVAAPFIPFLDSLTLYQSYLQGKKQFNLFSVSLVTSQFFSIALVILTLFFTKNIIAILFAYLASWTFFRAYFFYLSIKRYPPDGTSDPSIIQYGIHASATAAIVSFITSLDQILIFHYVGAAGVAIFAFAFAPVAQLAGLFKNIPILAIPKLAERNTKSINVLLRNRLFLLAMLGSIIAAVYIVIAPYLFRVFFPQYVNAIFFSRLLALGLVLILPQTIIGAALSSQLSITPKKYLYFWNIPALASTVFILLTIQRLGVLSVVIARLLDSALVLLISFVIWHAISKQENSPMHRKV